jgi:hypothetical protein
MRSIVPAAALLALASIGLPAQSAPLSVSPGTAAERSAVEQVHYRYYRHHRHYRYYRRPGVYFYYGPRHHRHWRYSRHHRHWY